MRSTSLAALVTALVLVTAGCAGPVASGDTTARSSATDRPDSARTETSSGTDSVAYTVVAGSLPEAFATLEVTLQVVWLQTPEDTGACWRDTYTGPYKPTVTPIPTPTGECERSSSVTIDLASLDESRRIGPFERPDGFTGGHGLIVTEVTARHANGTSVDGLRGVGGIRAHVVRGEGAAAYRVTFRVPSYDGWYDYWLVADTIQKTDTDGD